MAGISLICDLHVAESCRVGGWRVAPPGARMGYEDPATGRAPGCGRRLVRVCAAGSRLRRPGRPIGSPGSGSEPPAGRAAGHVCRRVAGLAAGGFASVPAALTAGRLGGAGIGDPQP